MRAYLELAGAGLAVLLCWGAYIKGGEHATNAIAAEQSAAKDKAAVAITARDAVSTAAYTNMLDYLRANIPATEIRTHDTVERIRTVYRDRPMSCVHERPASVQAELDAANDAARAAISSM